MTTPQDEINALRQALQAAQRELVDYRHYAHNYGNANGVCETGYPQHPGYICGRCGQDRSIEPACGRAKNKA